MAKKRAARAPAAAPASAGMSYGAMGVASAAALIVGISIASALGWPSSSPAAAPNAPSAPAPPPARRLPSDALSYFSAEHNASLLWGTYRPGTYFGLRSRTAPTGLVAGLMWAAHDGPLRHECEQDGLQQYGYTEHDGQGYGAQRLLDHANAVDLHTSFLADGAGWVGRVAARRAEGQAARELSAYVYVALEDEYAAPPRRAGALRRGASLGEGTVHLEGEERTLGRFSLLVRPSAGEAVEGARVWGTAAEGEACAYAAVRQAVSARLGPRGELRDEVEEGARLLVLQLAMTPPFSLDLLYVPGGCGEGQCDALLRDSSSHVTAQLAARHDAFSSRLERTFALPERKLRDRPLGEPERAFAAAALSAQLGSIGYFYGESKVASQLEGEPPGHTDAAPLTSVVPSRSFFPRGFLWDEGFHQLVVAAWSEPLADDILLHWLGLMHTDGWIPREQILGAEARARVPSEFLVQHRHHANPPTLLLRLQRLADSLDAATPEAEERLRFLRKVWVRLLRWYHWYISTQAGAMPGTFRWRGRDASDGKLNAMTLSSGLDDFPRATSPTEQERHVDLLCWVAFASRLLGRLAAHLGMGEEAEKLRAAHEAQLQALEKFHWNEKLGAYCDHGLHANEGAFKPHYVVKCGTADGSSSVEHDIADPRRPDCPRSHPKFMFPLGDGRGGLLMRERFTPRKLRHQWVEHLGYVALFPLMLRLLPADSPRLPRLLDLLRDPAALWTPYGLRSLSKSDAWYARENAPGDQPYWRGPIWVNLNYLCLAGLHHYANLDGPVRGRAAEVYSELRNNLVGNMLEQWRQTGYFWEQYNPDSGVGQRTHPFNGWSSLALLALAEVY